MTKKSQPSKIRVAELFAGVGGFRVGLDRANKDLNRNLYETVWANQWEPPGTDTKQFAWRCYESHFGKGSCVNDDIDAVLDMAEQGDYSIPDFDLLVGGFPCQDYSVAKPLAQAGGIEGKKGVLWWDIYRMLELKKPKYVLLENVDRLLKSPATQRGRDFAIMLSCLFQLHYSVEWHVINAAEYGMPQKRRRVYIFAIHDEQAWDLSERLFNEGVVAKAFPIVPDTKTESFELSIDPYETTNSFGKGDKVSKFLLDGVMQEGKVLTTKGEPVYTGDRKTLGNVLVPEEDVPDDYYVPDEQLRQWKYLKGSKKEDRTHKSGFTYKYSEGSMAFPDPTDGPSRTILTGEGGRAASRFKHVIETSNGRYRRLVPDELDQLQCFPKGWTDTGLSDHQRAFCMGNALVTEIPTRIGIELAKLF